MNQAIFRYSRGRELTVGQCATLACLMEVSAPKPGNVHRGADFEDMTFEQFVASAVAIGPAMDEASERSLGETLLTAVCATQDLAGTNTNLGTLLLLVPLAAADFASPNHGVPDVLKGIQEEDAALYYEAIRRASPGGMGKVDKHDLSGPPPRDLLAAMKVAAGHDLIARQYTNQFAEVFDFVVPQITKGLEQDWPLSITIIDAYLRLMREYPDSLIARKCGEAIARESSDRAARVIASGKPTDFMYQQALADFDFWLRSDGHRRNPGTSADLIAGGLFVLLRRGLP